jgi:hypothetical protein
MEIHDWQMQCLSIEQQAKIYDCEAIIDSIMPLISEHLRDKSMAPIIARMIAQNEFNAPHISVEAFTKPYIKQDVIVIKIDKWRG